MKPIFLKFSLFFFVFANVSAQTKDIEVTQNNVNGAIVISVKNNTSERQEVSLTITGNGFEKIKTPVTKNVNKAAIIEFVTLKPTSKSGIQFSSNYTYISKPTDEEMKAKSKKLETKKPDSAIDFSKGIIVFTKTRCPRCTKILNYLLDHNIVFTHMNITENQEYNNLMWKKLEENKVSNEIVMPVIMINGKLTHSHQDLDSFLKKIK